QSSSNGRPLLSKRPSPSSSLPCWPSFVQSARDCLLDTHCSSLASRGTAAIRPSASGLFARSSWARYLEVMSSEPLTPAAERPRCTWSGSLSGRVAAVCEVLLAFALVHLAYRSFKHFTELGRLEVGAGLNFSPGVT